MNARYFEEGIVDCPMFTKLIHSNLTCSVCDYLNSVERDRIYCGYTKGEPQLKIKLGSGTIKMVPVEEVNEKLRRAGVKNHD
jgi:hypothetical protein